jgi:hypothetical protein
MSQPNSNLDREAFILMKREEQNHSRFFLTEEEYFTTPPQPSRPGLWDAVMIIFGDWLIKVGSDLKTRNVCTQLSEKQV